MRRAFVLGVVAIVAFGASSAVAVYVLTEPDSPAPPGSRPSAAAAAPVSRPPQPQGQYAPTPVEKQVPGALPPDIDALLRPPGLPPAVPSPGAPARPAEENGVVPAPVPAVAAPPGQSAGWRQQRARHPPPDVEDE